MRSTALVSCGAGAGSIRCTGRVAVVPGAAWRAAVFRGGTHRGAQCPCWALRGSLGPAHAKVPSGAGPVAKLLFSTAVGQHRRGRGRAPGAVVACRAVARVIDSAGRVAIFAGVALLALGLPASSWNSPLVHSTHAVAPSSTRFALLPGKHLVHAPDALLSENSPTGHGVQLVTLPPALNCPGTHSTH